MAENGLYMMRLSGVNDLGSLTDVESSRYNYWTGSTPECYNTVAKNYLLSLVNAKLVELEVLDDIKVSKAINELDLYLVCLESLKMAVDDDADLVRCGAIISSMYSSGMFENNSEDDFIRSENLDGLIDTFVETYNSNMNYTFDEDFRLWWYEKIIENNYNGLDYETKEKYIEFFSEKESISGDDKPQNMAEYISNSGVYFLYLFIPENDIKKLSKEIQDRYAKEVELYTWLQNSTKGLYDSDTLYNLVYRGVILEYKMTPQAKILQLKKLGSESVYIGALSTSVILAIISFVLTIVLALIGMIQQIVVAKYHKPAGEQMGIPQENDWGLDQKPETEETSKLSLGLLAGAGVLGLVMFNKFKNK